MRAPASRPAGRVTHAGRCGDHGAAQRELVRLAVAAAGAARAAGAVLPAPLAGVAASLAAVEHGAALTRQDAPGAAFAPPNVPEAGSAPRLA